MDKTIDPITDEECHTAGTTFFDLANAMSWRYYELEALGETRYKERMHDLIEHGINDKLKEEFKRS